MAERTPARRIRILLVDDEPLVRQGLRLVLETEPDLEVVAEAGDGAAALAAARQLEPDVACLDVRMPEIDGIRATELLLGLPRPPKVLVVTTFSSDDHLIDALRAGAAGFVLKRATAEELVAAVRAVAAGDSLVFPRGLRKVALRSLDRPVYAGPPLSPREAEVLALMAEGLGNAAIAGRLVVGVETVRSHVAAVLRKLGARDRTHAVVRAAQLGLVDLGPGSRGGARPS